MTPEFGLRIGIVLDSPYWKSDDEVEYSRLLDDRWDFKRRLQPLDVYDDMTDEDKKTFDEAEAQALAEMKAYNDFVSTDTDGFGRICETITYGTRALAHLPAMPPPPGIPPGTP